MTLPDLFFLASLVLVLILAVRIFLSALRSRWETARHSARLLGMFVACYAVVLIAVALVLPRRFYAAGERLCFDDWCVASLDATLADNSAGPPCPSDPNSRTWVAQVEVSSVAKRIHQRARDAQAELEDQHGRRYAPCAEPLPSGPEPPHLLSDSLGPGESFRVLLPFQLPSGAKPAGIIVHHGAFPGLIIIGADQSFLHPPALLHLSQKPRSDAGRRPSTGSLPSQATRNRG